MDTTNDSIPRPKNADKSVFVMDSTLMQTGKTTDKQDSRPFKQINFLGN